MNDIFKINPTININFATNYGFIKNGKLEPIYIEMQKKYYLYFEKFLIKKLNLEGIENELKKSEYFHEAKGVPIELKYPNETKLKYFFIRNNLNIEKLNLNDINILMTQSNDDILLNLIERTFKETIKVDYYFGRPVIPGRILYDGNSEEYLKYTNSVILGLYYGKYQINISDQYWDTYIEKNNEIKETVLNFISKVAVKSIDCLVEFIDYSDEDMKEKGGMKNE